MFGGVALGAFAAMTANQGMKIAPVAQMAMRIGSVRSRIAIRQAMRMAMETR